MKIKTSFLKQVIKEEIRKQLYGDPIKRKVVHLFIKARDSMDDPSNQEKVIENLISDLRNIGVDPKNAINILDTEKIDQNLYIRCIEIHNEIAKLTGGKEKKLNAFAHFPRIDHNPDIDQDPEFLRKPINAAAKN